MLRMTTLSGLCCGLLLLTACGDDNGSQDDASSYGGDGGSSGSSSGGSSGRGRAGSGGKGGSGGKAAGAGGAKAAGAGGATEAAGSREEEQGGKGEEEQGGKGENAGGKGGSISENSGGKGGSGGKEAAAGESGGGMGGSAGGAAGSAAGSGGMTAGSGGSAGAAGAAGEEAGAGGAAGESGEGGAGGEEAAGAGGSTSSANLPAGGTFLAAVTSDDQAAAVCQAAETKSMFDFGDFTTLRSGVCANTGHVANMNSGADCATAQADCVTKAEAQGAPGGAACKAADIPDCMDVTVDEYINCAAANLQAEFHTYANLTCTSDFSMMEMFTVPAECEAIYQRCPQLMGSAG